MGKVCEYDVSIDAAVLEVIPVLIDPDTHQVGGHLDMKLQSVHMFAKTESLVLVI